MQTKKIAILGETQATLDTFYIYGPKIHKKKLNLGFCFIKNFDYQML